MVWDTYHLFMWIQEELVKYIAKVISFKISGCKEGTNSEKLQ